MTFGGRRLGDACVTLAVTLVLAGCASGGQEESAPSPLPDGTPRIVVDASRTFQTISGWEATAQAGQDLNAEYPAFRDPMLDHAVNELGLNRLRLEIRSGIEHTRDTYAELLAGTLTEAGWRPVRYATVNDNADPFSLNMSRFHFTELDNEIEKVALPMKRRLEARGERLFINVCYVAFTGSIRDGAYHHAEAEEYAEFVQATFQHLEQRYGITPDAWEMHLEPDNTKEWTPAYMRRAMIATGNRLIGMGRMPQVIAPSTTNMANALDYADYIAREGVPRLWSMLSYHRYGGVSERTLRAIADRAAQWKLQTAMLEHIGSGADDLHQDLKRGNNSAWQRFILTVARDPANTNGMYYVIDLANPESPRISLTEQAFQLQQYFRYIRQGAVRIGATASDDAFDPVAFVNTTGRQVVVVQAKRSGTFEVEGLARGSYEMTYATARDRSARLGIVAADSGQPVRVTMPARGVLTLSRVEPGG